jgi:hypothetical protein
MHYPFSGWFITLSRGLRTPKLLSAHATVGLSGGAGSINPDKDAAHFVINSYKEGLNIVIPHFDKYPLPHFAHKSEQYLLWKDIVLILNKGNHMTESREDVISLISRLKEL